MAKPWEQYHQIIIETYSEVKSVKSSHIHARPVAGEIYPQTLDVECSRAMRRQHPVGSKFRVWAKLTDRKGGGEYLYTSWQWPYDLIDE